MADIIFVKNNCIGLSQENRSNVTTNCVQLYDNALSSCRDFQTVLDNRADKIRDLAAATDAFNALDDENALNAQIAGLETQKASNTKNRDSALNAMNALKKILGQATLGSGRALTSSEIDQITKEIERLKSQKEDNDKSIDEKNKSIADLKTKIEEWKVAQEKVEKAKADVELATADAQKFADGTQARIDKYRACQKIPSPSPAGNSTVGDQQTLSTTGLEPISSGSSTGTGTGTGFSGTGGSFAGGNGAGAPAEI